jgi:hypothetical protein
VLIWNCTWPISLDAGGPTSGAEEPAKANCHPYGVTWDLS